MSNVPSGPPPVDPMSDVAWARVERGLMQRLDAESVGPMVAPVRRRWMWLAAPALAVAAAIALVLGLRGGGSDAPSEPSRVVAGNAPSSVLFGDAHLALGARTAIVMTHEAAAPSVLVERGHVGFTVEPRAGRPPFIVRAGDVVVRVVGTKFEVARYDERVTVTVDHGLVDVVFQGATTPVGAGQRWSSEAPGAATTIAVAPAPPPTIAAVPKPPAPSVKGAEQAEFERLTALEAKNPDAAIAGYVAMSRGTSAWASNALFAAARLAADRKDPRARTYLQTYLRRFPEGNNAADAKSLLDRR